jgi:hypothetical protein
MSVTVYVRQNHLKIKYEGVIYNSFTLNKNNPNHA